MKKASFSGAVMHIYSSAGSVNSETAFMIKTDTEKAKEANVWKINK